MYKRVEVSKYTGDCKGVEELKMFRVPKIADVWES